MEKERRFTTGELMNGIIHTKDFDRYMRAHAGSLELMPLTEHLAKLLEEKQLTRAEVIRNGGIDRSFGYQVFNGTRKPARDTVLQLAIGFGLDYAGTAELLRIARKSELYVRLRRDAIIIYSVSHGLSIYETQYMLLSEGLTELGEKADKE